jgi:hypothetical protein
MVEPAGRTPNTIEWTSERRTHPPAATTKPHASTRSNGLNYISQDEEEDVPQQRKTRSLTHSILQEAMLACMDVTQPIQIIPQDMGQPNLTPLATKKRYEITPE